MPIIFSLSSKALRLNTKPKIFDFGEKFLDTKIIGSFKEPVRSLISVIYLRMEKNMGLVSIVTHIGLLQISLANGLSFLWSLRNKLQDLELSSTFLLENLRIQ